MTNEARPTATDDLLAKIDAVTTGHESQRTTEVATVFDDDDGDYYGLPFEVSWNSNLSAYCTALDDYLQALARAFENTQRELARALARSLVVP